MKPQKPQQPSNNILRPAFPQQLSLGFLVAYAFCLGGLVICIKSCLYDFSNVEKVLAFYGTYHREPVNQFIHFLGVPVILWTMVAFSAHLVVPGSIVLAYPRPHYANMGTVWILVYAAFYLYLDVVGAVLYAPFLYLYYSTSLDWISRDQLQLLLKNKTADNAKKGSNSNHHWMGSGTVLWYALIFHILAWYVQIHPGHAIFEGASPAVMTNLGAGLMAAPLFAFYEGVWAVGLRPALHHRILELVAHNTYELCSHNSAAMRACETLH